MTVSVIDDVIPSKVSLAGTPCIPRGRRMDFMWAGVGSSSPFRNVCLSAEASILWLSETDHEINAQELCVKFALLALIHTTQTEYCVMSA